MSEKRKIRTTMRPHEEIGVTEAEYLDLSRQGFIHEEPAEPVTEPATVEIDVPAETTVPEVTREQKIRNRRASATDNTKEV